MFLSSFNSIRPPFETLQEQTLEWLIDAHTQAEKTKGMSEKDIILFQKTLQEKFWHVGCKPDRIQKRGHILRDFKNRDWDQMEIYKLNQFPEGENLAVRSRRFAEFVDQIFEEYYPEESSPPDHIIHVSCTGYVSPSGAQKIVSKRPDWGTQTTVTHAYHMGCYGSLPAIRMGIGFAARDPATVDIVHTEICSLHSNPSLHTTDQLVSQSLFADGFMKYTLTRAPLTSEKKTFKLITTREEIIPNSTQSMTWNVSNWGFQMTLARELPVLIARSLKSYLDRLCLQAQISYEDMIGKALFAIHPGGPKILVNIQELLALSSEQMHYSFEILKNFGNMSSATLPHIWQAILENKQIKNGTWVVSLAFGPGLTISGAIMEKICGF